MNTQTVTQNPSSGPPLIVDPYAYGRRRIPNVVSAVPPDALLGGIAVCGGVENYYNFCVNQTQHQFSSLAQQYGITAHTLFPDNAHEVIEQAVTVVQKKRLTIVADLIAAGLTTPLPDWWAIPSLRRGRIGEGGSAHRTMVPDSRGERFVLQRGSQAWPIFCTWSNFSFSIRDLAVGRRMGTPLDVSHATEATYRDNEAIEDQAINGLTDDQGSVMTIDGLSADGLLSTTTVFDYADWNTLTGAAIRAVVAGAIQQLRITHPGPYTVYYPGNYDEKLQEPYSALYDSVTIRAEIEKLGPYGGRNIQMKLADTLPDHRVVVIQMDTESVDVVIGQQPVPVSWQDGPGWNTYWVVLACVIFRMFQSENGKYGVAAGNLT